MFSTWGGGLIEREALIKVKGLSEDGLFMKGGAEWREYSMCSITLSDFYGQMSLTYSLAPRFY